MRQSDINLLKPCAWLNDGIINFYYEYLTNTVIDKENRKKFVLMDPCAVADLQYFKFTGDPVQDEDMIDMFAPLKLHEAQLVLLPVNDN